MKTTPADLPDTIEELRALVLAQRVDLDDQAAKHEELVAQDTAKHEQTLSEYSNEISHLREYIRLLKSQRFGPSSERTVSDQPGLFNEAEALCDSESGDEDEASEEEPSVEIPGHTRRKRGGRRPLPDFLPRVEILHDLPEDQKVCANDPNHTLVMIGEEKSEKLALVPAKATVEVHTRPKYACPTCKDGVKTEPLPPQPIPKSMATPSLLAQLATSKFVDGSPFYRQEAMFRRMGVDLHRATMARWMIRMGELVEPLLARMLHEIWIYDYVQCDETPFQVLKEDGKRATSLSYLWALCGGMPERPLHYYRYSPTREGEVAAQLLSGFHGYMQTDGYKGYDALGGRPGIVHIGCFAHARRKFDEALRGQSKNGKNSKSGSNPKQSLARQGFGKINKLYKIERSCRDASPEERDAIRQERMKPRLDELREWLDESRDRVPKDSLSGKAMWYLHNQWPKLERVLLDGRIPLDTNAVERSIRPFAVGRRNWLFADTPKGATASANIYSLVETAKANALEPWSYLAAVFERLPAASGEADIEALLPWRIELDDLPNQATRSPAS